MRPGNPGTHASARVVGLLGVAVVAVSLAAPVMASLTVPALAISMWRNGLAALLLAPVALVRRRDELAALVRTQRRELGRIGLAGACLAAHFGFWVTSLRMTSVAASTAIVCTQVAWVVAWGWLRGRRQPGLVVLGVAVAFSGVLVITGVDVAVSGRALLGDLFALIGSIAVAAYTMIGARARAVVSTTTYTSLCYGVAAVLLLVAALVSGDPVVGFTPRQWALLVLVTLTAQLLGHSVLNHLLDRVSPMLVSLTLLLEIPGAALLAAALLGQVPPVGVLVGLLLILAGMALVVLRGSGAGDGASDGSADRDALGPTAGAVTP